MQAEQLAREGLNPLSRQNMLNMKRRYSNEIVPTLQAVDSKLREVLAVANTEEAAPAEEATEE